VEAYRLELVLDQPEQAKDYGAIALRLCFIQQKGTHTMTIDQIWNSISDKSRLRASLPMVDHSKPLPNPADWGRKFDTPQGASLEVAVKQGRALDYGRLPMSGAKDEDSYYCGRSFKTATAARLWLGKQRVNIDEHSFWLGYLAGRNSVACE
jgi:hypothetical protein